MKAVRVILALVFIFGLIGFSATPTRAQAFVSYVSGVTMQNLSNTSTTVQADYYDLTGTIVATTSDTIAGFGVKDYATIPTNPNFKGSVVISSGAPVGAVSTLRGDNKGRDSYIAFSSGGSPVLLPVIMKNWGSSAWNTWFTVQNIGGADATVNVKYAACSGTVNASTTGLKPNASYSFAQATEPCMTAPKVLTSATVTSDQPIVVEVVQESTIVNSLLASPGFTSGDLAPVIPLMNSNNPNTSGWRTAISVFNMGTQDTEITLTYVNSADGVSCTEKSIVGHGVAKVFAGNNLILPPPAGVTTTCTAGKKIIGSAFVSGNSTNQLVVATVNQDRGSLASAYGALAPSSATPKVVFPQIQDRNGAASQWASSIMVMNVSGHTVYVKCTFANSPYSPTSGALNDYKSWENLERGQIAPSYVGSGQCTAYTNTNYNVVDTNAKIVAAVNIRGLGVGLYDLMMSYDGINVTP
jgi:hypothetical protein